MPRRKRHLQEYAELGRRIRILRSGLGWTQADLAQHAGLSSSYLAEIERGGRNPSLETILNIAAALHVDGGYLVDGSRRDLPSGLKNLAGIWTALSKEQQKVISQIGSLLASGNSAPVIRLSSTAKRRAKVSK